MVGDVAPGSQPHAAIAAPGTSTLSAVVSTLDSPISGWPDSVFISQIGLPVIRSSGAVVTDIRYSDANESVFSFSPESLSSFDNAGVRTDLVTTGLLIPDTANPALTFVLEVNLDPSQLGNPGSPVFELNDGSLLFGAGLGRNPLDSDSRIRPSVQSTVLLSLPAEG